MSYLVVANFKSHKTSAEVSEWVKDVAGQQVGNIELAVAPAFPHLSLISPLTAAAQDVSSFPSGSYTGAVNAKQLKDLSVKYTIVGHSERRRYFHETESDVANKVKELLEVGITPIVCLAEEDITPQRAALPDEHVAKCIFCFEPPSAIGGAESAPADEITRVTDLIKTKYGAEKVMYGGSVNADNIASLAGLGLSGFLVAGASLDAKDFIRVVEQLNHAT